MQFLATSDTEVWTPSPAVPLMRFARRARSIAATGLDLLGLPDVDPPASLIQMLRSFDSIVSWYGSNRVEFREALARVGAEVEFLAALPGAGNREHCADFFARQVGAPEPAIPRIDCGAAAPGNYAVIHPFSGSARKNWPLRRYRELAELLGVPVRWCAGPDDAAGPALRDVVQIEDLYELGQYIAGARVYIGNDSGITHLAAAAGAPVVALFGPTDPGVWGPRGSRVRIVQGALESTTVQRVADEVAALMR